MDKPLLEYFSLAAHIKVTGHFEPAGPWENADRWEVQKIITYDLIDHFAGTPTGWLYEDYSNTSCEVGFDVGEEWMVSTLADVYGGDHAGLCIGVALLRDANGRIARQARNSKGIYSAFLEACGIEPVLK